jgi:predicted RNA-binding Zn ribbon-like protein
METALPPAHTDDPMDGALAIEFQHTEIGPSTNLPLGPSPLKDYDDLVAWADRFGVIGAREARQLRHAARRNPTEAKEAYARALRVRDTLDEVFRAIAVDATPSVAATATLARHEADAVARGTLVRDNGGFAWSWAADTSLGRPLWPVIHDATRLVIDGPLDRVKACDGCRYLFIDQSKNRSRRWCEMSTCGTAEKMRRYVERRAAKRATAAIEAR